VISKGSKSIKLNNACPKLDSCDAWTGATLGLVQCLNSFNA